MKQQKNPAARVEEKMLEMRKLYSRIGEPLPVDVIIDLRWYLGKALELAEEGQTKPRGKRTACERLH